MKASFVLVVFVVLLVASFGRAQVQAPAYFTSWGSALTNDVTLTTGDDTAIVVPLNFTFNLFGASFNACVVYTNGLISLGPTAVPNDYGKTLLDAGQYVVAPYWADADNSGANGGDIYYRNEYNNARKQQVSQFLEEGLFTGTNITGMFVVTWVRVKAYPGTSTNLTATFQAILASSASDSFVIFNYGLLEYQRSGISGADVGFSVGNSTAYYRLVNTTENTRTLTNRTNFSPPKYGQFAFKVSNFSAPSSPLTTGQLTTSPLTTSPLTTSPLTTSPLTTSPLTTLPLTTLPLTTSPLTTSELTTSPLTSAALTTAELTTEQLTTAPITSGDITSGALTTQQLTTGDVVQTCCSLYQGNPTFISASNMSFTLPCGDLLPVLGVLFARGVCDAVEMPVTGSQTQISTYEGLNVTRTWNYLDNCGRSATVIHKYFISADHDVPLLTLPPDAVVSINCSEYANLTLFTGPSVTGTATAVDCSEVSVSYTDTNLQPLGNCTSIISRSWTATDVAANKNTAIQNITVVRDLPAPTFLNFVASVNYQCGSEIPIVSGLVDTTCAANLYINSNYTDTDLVDEVTCTGLHKIRRNWKLTDECGKSTSYQQVITPYDNLIPEFNVFSQCIWPANNEVVCFNPLDSRFVTAVDSCSAVTISYNGDCVGHPAENCVYNKGQLCLKASNTTSFYSYSYNATDACGNVATTMINFNIQDGVGCLVPQGKVVEEVVIPVQPGVAAVAFEGNKPAPVITAVDPKTGEQSSESVGYEFSEIAEVYYDGRRAFGQRKSVPDEFTIIEVSTENSTDYKFSTIFDNGATLTATASIPKISYTVEIPGVSDTYSVAPGTIKMSFKIENWKFNAKRQGTPSLLVQSNIKLSSPAIELPTVTELSNRNIYTFETQSSSVRIGFLTVGIADGVDVVTVPFTVEPFNGELGTDFTVSYYVPRFTENFSYDPDFSILLDEKQGGGDSSATPSEDEGSNTVAYAVSSVVVVLIVVGALGGFLWYKKHKSEQGINDAFKRVEMSDIEVTSNASATDSARE